MADNKKAKRLSKEKIKTKLLDSITIDEVLDCEYLNKEAEEVRHLERAAKIIKWYEDIIKTKNKEIINVAYYQGQVFKSLLNLSMNQEFTEILLFLELMF